MRANLFFVGLLSVGLVGGLMPACGGSSGGGGTDGGGDSPAGDSSKPKDAAKDKGGPADTGGTCTGLDAAAMMIMFTPACGACVDKNVCAPAQACAADPACITIIQCQLACIADGGTGLSCATSCIDASKSMMAKTEATTFDEGLQGSCSTACVAAKK